MRMNAPLYSQGRTETDAAERDPDVPAAVIGSRLWVTTGCKRHAGHSYGLGSIRAEVGAQRDGLSRALPHAVSEHGAGKM
jgi:hypothetical protein